MGSQALNGPKSDRKPARRFLYAPVDPPPWAQSWLSSDDPLLRDDDFDAIEKATKLAMAPTSVDDPKGWKAKLDWEIRHYIAQKSLSNVTATDKEEWAKQIFDFARSLLFSLGLDPSNPDGLSAVPASTVLRLVTAGLGPDFAACWASRLTHPEGVPARDRLRFVRLPAPGRAADAFPPHELFEQLSAMTPEARSALQSFGQALAGVTLLADLADRARLRAEREKTDRNFKRFKKAGQSFDYLFRRCNPIYEAATGRAAGGTRNPLTGDAGGPCVRFYSALFARIRSRLSETGASVNEDLSDELNSTPRAILERIQDANSRIRNSRLREGAGRG
jgi:hypothetical protein